jgi:alkylresorcinol/alkylpyrone synthase
MFHHDTEGVVGFAIGESGFRVVLREDLPEVAARGLRTEIDQLLSGQGLRREDIAVWVVHPGGPKVLRSLAQALSLSRDALQPSWECLRQLGNVSSASVLCILQDVLDAPPPPGSYGVVLGMGPGFSAEAVLLRWD